MKIIFLLSMFFFLPCFPFFLLFKFFFFSCFYSFFFFFNEEKENNTQFNFSFFLRNTESLKELQAEDNDVRQQNLDKIQQLRQAAQVKNYFFSKMRFLFLLKERKNKNEKETKEGRKKSRKFFFLEDFFFLKEISFSIPIFAEMFSVCFSSIFSFFWPLILFLETVTRRQTYSLDRQH